MYAIPSTDVFLGVCYRRGGLEWWLFVDGVGGRAESFGADGG